ncbi:MAG: LysM peptidoglycan-binding domain-containing protein [Deltaproteobacteria bacterium]|nr:LysM peptidoglycan-binding domain-containing protein [Deltaproteobacteria bacterium]
MRRACIRSRRLLFLVVVVGVCGVVAGAAWAREGAPRLAFGNEFHLSPAIEEDVRFWIDVFTRYALGEAIVHDRGNPSHVLAVVPLRSGRSGEIDDVRRRYLKLTAALRTASSRDLSRLLAPFGPPLAPRSITDAADRIRVQPGQREVFRASLLRSQRYLPMLRKVLSAAGVPPELAYLPHVESSFDTDAESRAGAIGLWQLMPETARELLLRVDDEVDERRQPHKATAAAATYLRDAYDRLESWPLAVTSYNHGLGGTLRAVASVGSRHLHDILAHHSSPSFGFASRSFYALFLAAVHVAENEDWYFPEIAEMRRREYVVQKGDSLWLIARRHGVTVERIRSANKLTESARLQLGQRIMMPG